MKNERKRGENGKTLGSTWEGFMRKKPKWVAILMIKFLQKMKLGCQSDLWPEKALNRATAITSSFQSGTSFAMKSFTFKSIFPFSSLCSVLWEKEREERKPIEIILFYVFMIFFLGVFPVHLKLRCIDTLVS